MHCTNSGQRYSTLQLPSDKQSTNCMGCLYHRRRQICLQDLLSSTLVQLSSEMSIGLFVGGPSCTPRGPTDSGARGALAVFCVWVWPVEVQTGFWAMRAEPLI